MPTMRGQQPEEAALLKIPGEVGLRTDQDPAFVLSGGGNLGAVQVGMLYALVEHGIRPSMIVGTSVGAINGAFLASRSDLSGIREIAGLWSSLRRRDVLGVSLASILLGIVGRRGYLFESIAMRAILESFLSFRRLEDAPIPLAVVATARGTRRPVVLSSGDAATALLASAAVPRILPPVQLGGAMLVDGAATADVPVCQAISLGARELYVLPTAPAQVDRWLAETAALGRTGCQERPTVRIVTPPDLHIPLGDLSQTRRLLELGYAQAEAWLQGKSPDPPARRVRARRGGLRPAQQPRCRAGEAPRPSTAAAK